MEWTVAKIYAEIINHELPELTVTLTRAESVELLRTLEDGIFIFTRDGRHLTCKKFFERIGLFRIFALVTARTYKEIGYNRKALSCISQYLRGL